MATTQLCTFRLNGMLFGVEVLRVQEVIRTQPMTAVPKAGDVVRGLINLRGQIVTAIDLRERLRLPPRDDDSGPMNVVVRVEDGAVSFLVDEIGDVIEVNDDQFEPAPETLGSELSRVITGVCKLDSELLLQLDVDATIDLPTVHDAVGDHEGDAA